MNLREDSTHSPVISHFMQLFLLSGTFLMQLFLLSGIFSPLAMSNRYHLWTHTIKAVLLGNHIRIAFVLCTAFSPYFSEKTVATSMKKLFYSFHPLIWTVCSFPSMKLKHYSPTTSDNEGIGAILQHGHNNHHLNYTQILFVLAVFNCTHVTRNNIPCIFRNWHVDVFSLKGIWKSTFLTKKKTKKQRANKLFMEWEHTRRRVLNKASFIQCFWGFFSTWTQLS